MPSESIYWHWTGNNWPLHSDMCTIFPIHVHGIFPDNKYIYRFFFVIFISHVCQGGPKTDWIVVCFTKQQNNDDSKTVVIKFSVRLHQLNVWLMPWVLDLYSLSGKTSYRQIPWSLGAVRLDAIMIVSLCNLTGISVALPRRLSNFRAIVKI